MSQIVAPIKLFSEREEKKKCPATGELTPTSLSILLRAPKINLERQVIFFKDLKKKIGNRIESDLKFLSNLNESELK